MKIRCENCYKVLNPQEEYCTHCGAHSARIAEAMKTGNYGPNPAERLKINFILYLAIAFLGTGIFQTILAVVTTDANTNGFKSSTSFFVTSIICFVVLLFVNIKHLKELFFNGTIKQLVASLLIASLVGLIVVFLSLISKYTQVIPAFMGDYLKGGNLSFVKVTSNSLLFIIVSLVLSVIVEEFVVRRVLIDYFDEATMLSDLWIIILSAAVGCIMDFLWHLSFEVVICSLFINLLLSGIYTNTNRSLGLCIIIRLIIILISIIVIL